MSTINTENALFASLGLARNDEETKKSQELGQEAFLELMVTQLKNQDPFDPMDNGQFLGQIAQFSSVSGINELNNNFSALAASMTSDQAIQAGAMVGRVVMVPLEYGLLPEGGALYGEVNLPASTTGLVINVTDANGTLVRSMGLGEQSSGPFSFTWDGLADSGDYVPPGVYKLEAQATFGDRTDALETLVASRVDSVSLGSNGEGLKLNLEALGPISFNDVARIY